MERIKVSEVVKAVRGTLLQGNPETEINGVSMDSRTMAPGMAFFALAGERADGHGFLGDVILKGGHLLVVERDQALPREYQSPEGVCVIKVADTEKALQDLAAYYLSLFSLLRVGITGSTGKTTTKEMLYHILSEKYKTVRNQGNYNNLIGLPLSVFQVDSTTEAAIFEMGMDRLGEIHRLAEIVRPQVAIITNIGISHMERLGSRENILKAKMEITHFLGERDSLVINGDNDLLARSGGDRPYQVITAGQGEGTDIRISRVRDLGEGGIAFCLKRGKESGDFRISTPGIHNSMNGALAVAAALCLGADMKQAADGLARLESTDKRLHIIRSHGIKIIDDTYNASPDSMRAALDVLSSVSSTRKIAILGDMFELGADEEKYHWEIGEYASNKGINVILSVGKNAEQIALAAKDAGMQAFHFDSKDMLKSVLPQWIKKGDAILVKGSRGMAMDEIVNCLKEITG